MSDPTISTKATLEGGPAHGAVVMLQDRPPVYPVELFRSVPTMATATAMYERTDDWRRDGSLTYVYTGESPWQPLPDSPGNGSVMQ